MRLCGEWVWCVDMCVWLGVGLCVRVHVLVRKVGETSLDFQSVLLLLLLLLLQMCRNLSRACSNSKAKKCGQGTLLRCKSAMQRSWALVSTHIIVNAIAAIKRSLAK